MFVFFDESNADRRGRKDDQQQREGQSLADEEIPEKNDLFDELRDLHIMQCVISPGPQSVNQGFRAMCLKILNSRDRRALNEDLLRKDEQN